MDIDHIGAIVFELDAEGCVLAANRVAHAFFGDAPRISDGEDFFAAHVPPAHRAQARTACRRAFADGPDVGRSLEMMVRDAYGEPHRMFWQLTVDGEVVTFTGMDLSKAFQATEASSSRELADIKHALDASTIVAMTDVEGTITFVNDKFCEISGYSRDELLGENHRILNSGHHPKVFFKEMWATIRRGLIWRGDIKNKKKGGEFYWVSTTIVPFLDDLGRPRQYVALRHEITERKKAEEELLEANRRIIEEQLKLIQAEKLSSIGLLASGIAHEVNNPLSGVINCVKALHDKEMSSERREEYFRTALQGLERIQQTIRGLLDFARQRPPEHESFPVAQVISAALRLIAPAQRKKGLGIESAIEPVDLSAHADQGQVLQALLNVLLNAIYASPEKATIRVDAFARGDRVCIVVRDAGPGIPAQFLGRVCDPFFTTKPEGEGTGLGLAVTLGLLKANSGDLEVANAPEGGAEVTLFLGRGRVEN